MYRYSGQVCGGDKLNPFKRRSARTLQFPADYSLGRIYVDDGTGQRFLSNASGVIIAPRQYSLILKVTAEPVSLAHLSSLQPDDLDAVSFSHSQKSDDDLSHLSNLNKLKSLHLDYTELNGKGLKALNRLNLSYLGASWSQFCDAGAAGLQHMTNLNAINLSCSRISSEALTFLLDLPQLSHLSLWDTAVDGRASDSLAHMQSLTQLYLGGSSKCGDLHGSTWKHLTKLAVLELERTRMSDKGCFSLSEMPALTHLGLAKNRITDAGVEMLCGNSGLRSLTLCHTQITDRCVNSLTRLPLLEYLDLSFTQVSDSSLAKILALPALKQLVLTNSQVSEAAIKEASAAGKAITLCSEHSPIKCPRQLSGLPLSLPTNGSVPAAANQVPSATRANSKSP